MAITIAILRAAGLSAEMISRVCEIEEKERLAIRREQNRKNQRNQRLRHHLSTDSADSADAPPLKEKVSPIPPLKENNPSLLASLACANGATMTKRGTRLAANWEPSATDREFARGIIAQQWHIEADKFRDYWHARAGPNGVKLDWSATWRNWCRKVAETKGYVSPNGKALFDERPEPP